MTGPRALSRRRRAPVAVAALLAVLAAGAWYLGDVSGPAPPPEPHAAASAGEAPEPSELVPIDDESIAPLASADLALLVDAGDDHALLEELELYLWLEDRQADAH